MSQELIPIREEWVKHLMSKGEWPDTMLRSNRHVAVLMTQDWCPQWSYMKQWLDSLSEEPDLDIYYVLYNQESYFLDLMHFKETRFGNHLVPYVQYYRDGKLIGDSNAVSKNNFLERFKNC